MKPENFRSTVLITIVASTMLLAVIFNAQSQQQQTPGKTVRSGEIQASQWEYAFRFVNSNGSNGMEKVANEMASKGWHYLELESYGDDRGYMAFRRTKG